MSYIQPVTSHQNPKIKSIKALEMRKKRKESGQFVAEGLKVIATAMECGHVPDILVFEEGTAERGIGNDLVNWALNHRAEVLKVPYDIMEKLSGRDNPQSMMAVFPQRFRELPKDATGLWVALDEVRDPGNLGTIIRTVDAVGAKGVILVGQCCDPYSVEAVRATMGSVFAVPLVKMERKEFIIAMESWHGSIVATHLQGTDDFRKDYGAGPHMLLMGSEGPGLSDELTRIATTKVKIPMRGNADSLNLAVATALMLYEIGK